MSVELPPVVVSMESTVVHQMVLNDDQAKRTACGLNPNRTPLLVNPNRTTITCQRCKRVKSSTSQQLSGSPAMTTPVKHNMKITMKQVLEAISGPAFMVRKDFRTNYMFWLLPEGSLEVQKGYAPAAELVVRHSVNEGAYTADVYVLAVGTEGILQGCSSYQIEGRDELRIRIASQPVGRFSQQAYDRFRQLAYDKVFDVAAQLPDAAPGTAEYEIFTEPKHNFLRSAVYAAVGRISGDSFSGWVNTTYGANIEVPSHRLTIHSEVDFGTIKIRVRANQTGELLQSYDIDGAPHEVLVAILTTIVTALA